MQSTFEYVFGAIIIVLLTAFMIVTLYKTFKLPSELVEFKESEKSKGGARATKVASN